MTRWYMKPQFSCADTDADPAAVKKEAAASATIVLLVNIMSLHILWFNMGTSNKYEQLFL